MSQEFDIHRELWDYYDDSSRRVADFYEKDNVVVTQEDSDDFLHQLNHFIEDLDKRDPVVVVETRPPSPKKLDTPRKVYDHIKENHK